jgi:hypothetical protein
MRSEEGEGGREPARPLSLSVCVRLSPQSTATAAVWSPARPPHGSEKRRRNRISLAWVPFLPHSARCVLIAQLPPRPVRRVAGALRALRCLVWTVLGISALLAPTRTCTSARARSAGRWIFPHPEFRFPQCPHWAASLTLIPAASIGARRSGFALDSNLRSVRVRGRHIPGVISGGLIQ